MIDGQLAAFLEEGLSVHVGVRDERLQPAGARAIAVAIDPDGTHLTVFVANAAASRLRPYLDATGVAAVSAGRPVDDRACQVKGMVVGIRPASDDERPRIATQWDGFMRQLGLIGIPREMAMGWPTWPAVAIRLKVTAVFEQTPGPQAGKAFA